MTIAALNRTSFSVVRWTIRGEPTSGQERSPQTARLKTKCRKRMTVARGSSPNGPTSRPTDGTRGCAGSIVNATMANTERRTRQRATFRSMSSRS